MLPLSHTTLFPAICDTSLSEVSSLELLFAVSVSLVWVLHEVHSVCSLATAHDLVGSILA
jgi:hypothetical protein